LNQDEPPRLEYNEVQLSKFSATIKKRSVRIIPKKNQALAIVIFVLVLLGAACASANPQAASGPFNTQETPAKSDAGAGIQEQTSTPPTPSATKSATVDIERKVGGKVGDLAPEFGGIEAWINSGPLTMEELRGSVVLIDFWTYTCINCINTYPFLKEMQSKYADQGLVIVGVHSPEFEFEKSYENVVAATQKDALVWPMAQDNDFITWRRYGNRYWPSEYLIDKDGVVRYTHFGEGAYAETEAVIRELLAEAGS